MSVYALTVIALVAGMCASCQWQETVNGVTHTHIVVADTDTDVPDAHHDDRIDVVLTHDKTWETCNHMGGGDLIYSPVTGLMVCEDTDF